LQPLRDNLESQTYETFEQDPVKYQLYNIAIRCCLEDRIASGQKYHTLMVVGGGRGPLVDAALSALKQLNITQVRSGFTLFLF
jgi:type II protein arginine methyltransferase